MRVAAPALLPIFRSRLQGELLALVLSDPAREWTVDALAVATAHPYQTVASEIRRLSTAGLLLNRSIGRSKLIRADADNPYMAPLAQLVLMSFGPPLVIGEEFGQVSGVEELYIVGSWAARYEGDVGPPPGDVDVLVVGRPDRDAVHDAARRAELRLRRDVDVTIRSSQRWAEADDGFTRGLRSSPLLQVPVRRDFTVAQATP